MAEVSGRREPLKDTQRVHGKGGDRAPGRRRFLKEAAVSGAREERSIMGTENAPLEW